MWTGRCYCGKTRLSTKDDPQAVTYCHCSDCRRASGAPVAAFVAFSAVDVTPQPKSISPSDGVTRWFCPDCGTPMTAIYDYLPDQIYVSLGVLDQADQLEPQGHSHADNQLPWLHIKDDLPRASGSARSTLGRS